MAVFEETISLISKGVHFLARQPRDWQVAALRTSLYRFFYQMVLPYLSIYIIALGATGTQLGLVNSVGMGVAALGGPSAGQAIDRIGFKRIYLIGIGLLAISFFTYGVAQSWSIIVIATLTYWLGFTISMHSCSVVCGTLLSSEDRATAMSCCESFAPGLLGMIGPMLGAMLVTSFGGVNVSGIRPLFFISLAGTIATFFLILTQLSDRQWKRPDQTNANFFEDLFQVFREGQNLKRFIVISSITNIPLGMIIPFAQVFAREVKGANQYILGLMVAGFALLPFLFGIPLGRLADKIGRKKVLYLMAPLFWASNLLLIWAPSSGFLVVSGILQGLFSINSVITSVIGFELVPLDQMGRWTGILRFFRMLFSAVSAYLAGIIWDNIGPQYLFLTFVGLDLLIRIPLLIGMPETLGAPKKNKKRE